MLPVGEDLVLQRQERAAGIDQIDARQMVLARNSLGAQMLLHRHRIIGAAFDGGVIGDDHAVAAADAADAGDQARRRHVATIHFVSGKRRQLQERRLRIDQQRDPLARRQLAARHVSGHGRIAAAALDLLELAPQFVDLASHGLGIASEVGRFRIDGRGKNAHVRPP